MTNKKDKAFRNLRRAKRDFKHVGDGNPVAKNLNKFNKPITETPKPLREKDRRKWSYKNELDHDSEFGYFPEE